MEVSTRAGSKRLEPLCHSLTTFSAYPAGAWTCCEFFTANAQLKLLWLPCPGLSSDLAPGIQHVATAALRPPLILESIVPWRARQANRRGPTTSEVPRQSDDGRSADSAVLYDNKPMPVQQAEEALQGEVEELITAAFKEHRGVMLYKASSVISNRDMAQDIVQQAFEKACKHPDGFTNNRGSVRNWLLTITHNTALDHLRSHKARPATSLEANGASTVATEPGRNAPTHLNSSRYATPDHAQHIADHHTLIDVLRQLPPHHRQILDLIYLQGYTPTEAAAYLGIPAGTARSRTYHALRSLKELLTEPPAASPPNRPSSHTGRKAPPSAQEHTP